LVLSGGRMGFAVLILVVGLTGTGLIFQAVATRNDQQKFPAPGELVDVGGYQLHIDCIGKEVQRSSWTHWVAAHRPAGVWCNRR
jgi:hypothetical protein